MSKPLCYLAGPMSGLPAYNHPAFRAYAAAIEAQGIYAVVNPADHGDDPNIPYSSYIQRGLEALFPCQAIALMPYWEWSRGALTEAIVAKAMGKVVFAVFLAEEEGIVWNTVRSHVFQSPKDIWGGSMELPSDVLQQYARFAKEGASA